MKLIEFESTQGKRIEIFDKFPELKINYFEHKKPSCVGRYRHKLSDILFIAFSNLIYNKEDFEDMEKVGNENITWLQGYLELPNSILSHDTFNRVLSILKPASLQKI